MTGNASQTLELLKLWVMGSGRSRCSRTGSYEVLDVSHEEAHSFLKVSGLAWADAERVVASVGGRLISLVASCESLEQGASISGLAPTSGLVCHHEAEVLNSCKILAVRRYGGCINDCCWG